MANKQSCPQCGTPMVATDARSEREITKGLVVGGAPVPYAANFAASVVEKRETFGVVLQCPACRYQMRQQRPVPATATETGA